MRCSVESELEMTGLDLMFVSLPVGTTRKLSATTSKSGRLLGLILAGDLHDWVTTMKQKRKVHFAHSLRLGVWRDGIRCRGRAKHPLNSRKRRGYCSIRPVPPAAVFAFPAGRRVTCLFNASDWPAQVLIGSFFFFRGLWSRGIIILILHEKYCLYSRIKLHLFMKTAVNKLR